MSYYFVDANRKMTSFRVKRKDSDETIKSFKSFQEALDFIEKLRGEDKEK